MRIHIDELEKMIKAEDDDKRPTKKFYSYEIDTDSDAGYDPRADEASGRYVLPGTENWQHVVSIQEGGYEWAELHAYYDPDQRRYFWGSESGCSCNAYDEFVTKVEDHQSGDKADLRRAILRFVEEKHYYFKPGVGIEATAEVARFTPKEA